ncbi:aldo/keto reductase [Amorphus orientalis]|uniref:Aryl-alcohol dehydrogenase-like predicted oxidoreductase n=1 Tax=Amorphus orientalis TaxID=649198 RepID=A0AAE4ASM2_9HYPH|nr:aldo/keto reductase [Amorphus orientalis]MDQ0315388.1 aryl-alcohol dehydrogenase-like predicted oxidoreductase [Amorphus orientalis]
MNRVALAPDYDISEVIRGGWQLAGGHGQIQRDRAVADLVECADAGITTFDCADIYTGVEEIMGAFRQRYRELRGEEALARIRVHTKFVPDLAVLPTISRSYVEGVIDRSLKRLRTERIDLVQFHWWDYEIPGCLDTAHWLAEQQKAGKIALLGGTNFDTDHVVELADNGYPLKTMQVQYSLLDARPARRMEAAAAARDIQFLCYGTVAGGFLSDRWLGMPEPGEPLENRSLTKYKLIIDDFGGWDRFQDLLKALRGIADAHDSDIATVASRAVLDRPQVAALIVGARNRAHLDANLAISRITLSDDDRAAIAAVVPEGCGPEGDVYSVERDRDGRHGAIMKYNLNEATA